GPLPGSSAPSSPAPSSPAPSSPADGSPDADGSAPGSSVLGSGPGLLGRGVAEVVAAESAGGSSWPQADSSPAVSVTAPSAPSTLLPTSLPAPGVGLPCITRIVTPP